MTTTSARGVVIGSINMDMLAKVDELPRAGETVIGSGFFSTIGETGFKPQVQLWGDLFVQPLLYESPKRRLILVNYNGCDSEVSCDGRWVEAGGLRDVITGQLCDPRSMRVPSLGLRITEPEAVS